MSFEGGEHGAWVSKNELGTDLTKSRDVLLNEIKILSKRASYQGDSIELLKNDVYAKEQELNQARQEIDHANQKNHLLQTDIKTANLYLKEERNRSEKL